MTRYVALMARYDAFTQQRKCDNGEANRGAERAATHIHLNSHIQTCRTVHERDADEGPRLQTILLLDTAIPATVLLFPHAGHSLSIKVGISCD